MEVAGVDACGCGAASLQVDRGGLGRVDPEALPCVDRAEHVVAFACCVSGQACSAQAWRIERPLGAVSHPLPNGREFAAVIEHSAHVDGLVGAVTNQVPAFDQSHCTQVGGAGAYSTG